MSTINERRLRARHRELLRRVGQQVRQLREDAGWTQSQVASAAGVTRSHVSRIESGTAEPSLEVLERVATALGAELGVRLFEGTGPQIRDHLQVAMSEALLAALHPRWRATPEVPVYRPVHGVIDLVLEDRRGADTVSTELHSQLRRVEQLIRWQTQKADGLALQPDEAGRHVSRLLVLRNVAAVRNAVRLATRTLEAAYPAKAADAVSSLHGTDPWPGAAIVWMTVERGAARLLDTPPRGVAVGR